MKEKTKTRVDARTAGVCMLRLRPSNQRGRRENYLNRIRLIIALVAASAFTTFAATSATKESVVTQAPVVHAITAPRIETQVLKNVQVTQSIWGDIQAFFFSA